MLNIDQNNYISAGNEEAGALVVVHHQTAMPYPEDNAIVIRPGMLTSIHVSRVIDIKTLRICVCERVFMSLIGPTVQYDNIMFCYVYQTDSYRLSSPYSDCVSADDAVTAADPDMFTQLYPVKYDHIVSSAFLPIMIIFTFNKCYSNSRRQQAINKSAMMMQGCYKTCFQRHMIDVCGCADSSLPNAVYNGSYPVCDMANMTQS